MATNKINAKTKSKDDKVKGNKGPSNCGEDDDEDFTILRKPIHTSISGFLQVRNIFDQCTEEFKKLIAEECNLLYECKVCDSIFRSVANFISHKRKYCTQNFNFATRGPFGIQQSIKVSTLATELMKIKQLEEGYKELLVSKNNISPDSNDCRVPLTKDLTTVIETLTKQRGVSKENGQQLSLQSIPTSSNAVFQSMKDENFTDDMQSQVEELYSIISQDKAVLQKDGKFTVESSLKAKENNLDGDTVIQISDDEDESHVSRCKLCNLQFSTQKTYKFHMKHKHEDSRLVYPCPDCLEIFSTSWSVYRHLFKVHRKSAAQIRRLRESIQSKAFRMNNPPASYEKKKNNMKHGNVQKLTEEERLDQENQEWMDNMEGDSIWPRCGGCGRMFERRAALIAHTQTCQPRSRALARRPIENRKVEIQIRKDYNKGALSTINLALSNKSSDAAGKSANENATHQNDTQNSMEMDKDLDKDVDKSLETKQPTNVLTKDDTSVNEELLGDNSVDNVAEYSEELSLPLYENIEQKNLNALKKKMEPEVNLDTLTCKKCNTICIDMNDMCKHMAEHFKWNRYGCKFCNFKDYLLSKLPEHIKTVHKLNGDNDFYYSAVKALDAPEAIVSNDINKSTSSSPESRRPSRCSSDSSRHSDNDSSSSNTRGDLASNSRKRKSSQSLKLNDSRRKKEHTPYKGEKMEEMSTDKIMRVIFGEDDNNSKDKGSEENSSDMDEVEDRQIKKQIKYVEKSNVFTTMRRPVRKRSKPKNDDFEYDLSNLLKMEAQGYRDSQQLPSTSRTTQNKKKIQNDTQVNEIFTKDYHGALLILSKQAVEKSQAHMRKLDLPNSNSPHNQRCASIFVKPYVPKIQSIKGITENISSKKQTSEEGEPKKLTSDEIEPKNQTTEDEVKKQTAEENGQKDVTEKHDQEKVTEEVEQCNVIKCTEKNKQDLSDKEPVKVQAQVNGLQEKSVIIKSKVATNKPKLNIPSVVPIKFRRESLDLNKSGVKRKILVIKPINRNKDDVQSMGKAITFQTIKLKDPSNSIKNDKARKISLLKVPPNKNITNLEAVKCVEDKSVKAGHSQDSINEKSTNDTNNESNTMECD